MKFIRTQFRALTTLLSTRFSKDFFRSGDKNTILFIIAGTSGSGKSTLLQKSHENNIVLFGAAAHSQWLKLNPRRKPETGCFQTSLRHTLIFQAAHIPKLRNLTPPPRACCLHLDLSNILFKLAAIEAQGRGLPLTHNPNLRVPRTPESVLCKTTNDTLLSHYLNDPFFSEFDHIIINTLHCDYPENNRRIMLKRGRPLFNIHDKALGTQVHSEVYACWQRNLRLLSPNAMFESRYHGGVVTIPRSPSTPPRARMHWDDQDSDSTTL